MDVGAVRCLLVDHPGRQGVMQRDKQGSDVPSEPDSMVHVEVVNEQPQSVAERDEVNCADEDGDRTRPRTAD